MKAMNKAVSMYVAHSNRKGAMVLWTQAGSVGIVCLAIGLGWFLFACPLTRFLKELASSLTEGTEQVASASEQIAASSQGLAQGSSEQASSLEETSASMEEMASMTKQNAENSKEAAQIASLCNLTAESGNRSINEMNVAMQAINESSKKIGDIIKVIDGIAFQTNLLALNAAVEAARAGEHGKGFAVVAEEVRNLAQRSATAAKDTTVLIEDCVSKADAGTKLSEKCKEVLSGIVTNVKKVNNLTSEISTASGEQTEGIHQVTKAINEMEHVTQQNATSAEETSSVSEEMSAQAQFLMDQIKVLSEQLNGTRQSQNDSGNNRVRGNMLKQPMIDDMPANVKTNGDNKYRSQQMKNPDQLITVGDDKVVEEHNERFKGF
jgi:methyl-accepting chemotaxis protein